MPNKMPTPNCKCPTCVLYYANLQICDLRVTIIKKGKNGLNFRMRHEDVQPFDLTDEDIQTSIMALIDRVIEKNLRVDHYFRVENPDFNINIERLSKNEYKFCFHAETKPVPDDADPLPMD